MADRGDSSPVVKQPIVNDKVIVLLKSVGDAPILKQKKFKVRADERFVRVQQFLRTQIAGRISDGDEIHFYIHSAFSPSPGEIIRNLAQCYHTNGQLIVEYSMKPTWG